MPNAKREARGAAACEQTVKVEDLPEKVKKVRGPAAATEHQGLAAPCDTPRGESRVIPHRERRAVDPDAAGDAHGGSSDHGTLRKM